MIEQCWLHIGIEKTGATSIQQFLAANRAALLRQNCLYPLSPGRVSHLDLVAYALDDIRIDGVREACGLLDAAQIGAFRNDLRCALGKETAASGAATIILSSELLGSRLRHRAEIERIEALCARFAHRTKILVYLRNQVDLLVSRYTNVIQNGGAEKFRIGGVAMADYAALLDRWAAVFGRENLVVRRFEPADFERGDLLSDFASVVRLERAKLAPATRYNESLDAECLVFLRAINRMLPHFLARRIAPLRSAAVAVLQRRRGGARFVIPPAVAERIEAHFRTSNELVSAEYFQSRLRPLFSPPARVGPPGERAADSIGPLTALRIACFLATGLFHDLLKRKR